LQGAERRPQRRHGNRVLRLERRGQITAKARADRWRAHQGEILRVGDTSSAFSIGVYDANST